MTHIRSALAAALLMLGSAAVMSAQQPAGHTKGARRGRNADAHLFKGITLSSAEQGNIKNVRTNYTAQEKTLRTQYEPQMKSLRDARQRGDTAAMRSLRAAVMPERKQEMSLRKSEQNDLRNALSADNQAKFDANAAATKRRFGKRGTRSGG